MYLSFGTLNKNNIMEKFTEGTFRQLAVINNEPCVTIYIPARKMGANSIIDTTRVRNLLRMAESKIIDGTYGTEGAALLSPLTELLADHSVWDESEKGLALFLAPGLFKAFRVPVDLEETLTVADRFDTRPLLPLVMDDGTFHLLSLSQNHLRLFRGTRQEFESIDLGKPFTSIEEFLRFVEPESQAQLHSGKRTVPGRRSKEDAVFHGTGSTTNQRKKDLQEFFRLVDHRVTHITGPEGGPLVLAGVEHVVAIYRSVSRYPHIVGETIEGNVDRMDLNALHDAGWKMVAPYFRRKKLTALENLRSLAGTGLTSDQPAEIDTAATAGRVEALLVSMPNGNPHIPARQPDDNGIMRLIGSVLSHGGSVYPVEHEDLPTTTAVAAVMRY